MEDVVIRIIQICIVLAALGGLWAFASWLPDRRLRKRLKARPVMDFDRWFDMYYADSPLDRDVVLRVHQLIAENAAGIHPTQILPSDRFTIELTDHGWSGMGGECDLEGVAAFLQDHGISAKELPLSCENVGQVAEVVCRLVAGKQVRQRGPFESFRVWAVYAVLLVMVAVAIWWIVKWLVR